MSRTINGNYLVGGLGLQAGRVGILDEKGVYVSYARVGQRLFAFIPPILGEGGVVRTVQWQLDGVDLPDENAFSIEASQPGLITFTGTDDAGSAVTSTSSVTVRGIGEVAINITPGELPDVSAITSLVEGVTFEEILALVSDVGTGTVSNGATPAITLEAITGTGINPMPADDRLIGIRQRFTSPGVATVYGDLVELNLAVAPVAISITQHPTTAGLTGLTTAMTVADAAAAWTGQPVATANNGEPVLYNYTFVSGGTAFTAASTALLSGNLTIEILLRVPNGENPVEAPLTVGPVTVTAAAGLPTISGTGPALPTTVVGETPPGYHRTTVTRSAYTASNGANVTVTATRVRVNGLLVPESVMFSTRLAVGDVILIEDIVSATGAETIAIAGAPRTAVQPVINVTTPATVAEITAGLTAAQAIGRVNPGVANASSGRAVVVNVTLDTALTGGLTAEGQALTFTITRTSDSAEPSITNLAATVAGAVVSPGLPDTGPYTLAQVESLRTDGSTRGVTLGKTLKKVGVDTLPAGMTRSGSRITVASGSSVGVVDGWDFSEHDFVINGTVAGFSDCKFSYTTDLALAMFDFGVNANLGYFKRCDFIGAGYYGNFTTKSCIRPRSTASTQAGPTIGLVERCGFFGWGSDVIKAVKNMNIRLCYFDTVINVPAGAKQWNATTNYVIGQYAMSSDFKYSWKALTSGSNKALPAPLTSNTNWERHDPHSDTINPFYQWSDFFLIEACYINRTEALRSIYANQRLAVGVNNGVRATRDTDDAPYNEVRMRNIAITRNEVNEAYPLHLQDQREALVEPATIVDSWVQPQKGGSIIINAGNPGYTEHTVTNVQDFTPSSAPTAGPGEVGTPGTGTGGGGTTPDPEPDPVDPPVIDLTVPAIVGFFGQSEPAKTSQVVNFSSSIAFYATGRSNIPNVDAENFTFYHYNGKFADATAPIKRRLTQADRKWSPDCIILIANALNRGLPGKQFVLSTANEAGSSRISLWSDNGYQSGGGDRLWATTQNVVNAVLADYPQGFDIWAEYWWASERGRMPDWPEEMSPFYYTQFVNGTAVAPGAIAGVAAKAPLDHSLYDFNTSGPTVKGRGLLPRTTRLMIQRKGTWGDDSDRKWAGVQRFVDDPRFKEQLRGVYGYPTAGWTGSASDSGHPDVLVNYGANQAGYRYYMPPLLLAANAISSNVPKFLGVFTASDGSYADVEFYGPNTGILSTPFKARNGKGGPAQNTSGNYYQELFGFEISRAAGGGRYWICRPGATGIDPMYQGTVTIRNNKARIVMVQPLQAGDSITHVRGHYSHRIDYPNKSPNMDNNYMNLAIEALPAFTDPNSPFPFDGLSVDTVSPSWVLVRGSYVGEGTPSAPVVVTPPANTAPVKTADPEITGTPLQGNVLTLSAPGAATGNPTPTKTYQWQKNTTNISGATGTSYTVGTVVAGDTFRVVMTAGNGILPNVTGTSNVLTVAAAQTGTNTPFTMSSSGPVLTDPSDVPAGTTKIRHAFKFRVPSAVSNTTSPRYLAVQRDGGFNLRLIVVSDGVSIVVEKIEDSTGAEAHPYSTRFSGGARNTWYEVDMAADLENRTLTMTVNGTAQSNTQFYAAGATTTFQSIRGMNWFALDPAGASALHAGVEIEYFDTYFKTNGVETLRKHITGPAATVNADPWKSGGNAT